MSIPLALVDHTGNPLGKKPAQAVPTQEVGTGEASPMEILFAVAEAEAKKASTNNK